MAVSRRPHDLFFSLTISVKDKGAKGDGFTDDTAAIQAAIDESEGTKIIVFPPGDYRYGRLTGPSQTAITILFDNTYFWLAPDAVLSYEGTGANSVGIRVAANNFKIMGGGLSGTWDLAGQKTAAIVGTVGNTTSLMLIRPLGVDASISGFTLNDVTIARAAGRALLFTENSPQTQNYGRVLMQNVRFNENFMAMQFNNLALAKPVEDIVFEDVSITTTASPEVTEESAANGGNGVFMDGTFDGLVFDRFRVRDCGRMGIELFMPSSMVAAGFLSQRFRLLNSDIRECRYRALSLLAQDQIIDGNMIASPKNLSTFLEIAGESIRFTNNTVEGIGWVSDEVPQGTITKKHYVVKDNKFRDIPEQGSGGAVSFKHVTGLTIEGNQADYRHPRSPIDGVQNRSIFDARDSLNLVMRNNHVDYTFPCNRAGGYDISKIRNGEIYNNTMTFNGVLDFDVFTPFFLERFEEVSVRKNTVHTDGPFLTTAPSIIGLPMRGGAFHRYTWSGGMENIIVAHTEILNDPPASPVINLPYAVGDNPTGDWLGFPRSFATWDGFFWTLEAILGIHLYEPNSPAWNTDHLSKKDTVGGAYLLSEGGWVQVYMEDNDFTTGDGIEAGQGVGVRFISLDATDGPIWVSRFIRNRDLIIIGSGVKISDVVIE